MKSDNPIDPLVRQSFGAPLPEDVRQAMHQQLEKARSGWRTRTEESRPVFFMYPRLSWLATAAGLLFIVLGGFHWARIRPSAEETRPGPSYLCATAHFPEKSITCTAVFYSKEDPTLWVERRLVTLDSRGNLTEIIAYNHERSQI
jgi:hypothetical protein